MMRSFQEHSGRGRARYTAATLVGALLVAFTGAAHAAAMTVYKTATCGCCKDWVAHVREAGFEVEANDVSRAELVQRKRDLGIDSALGACHTAVIEGYVVEGHVPAADIHRLLEQRPDIAGIAVPGMPLGSPGMKYGDEVQPYNVIAFDGNGGMEVFARYGQ